MINKITVTNHLNESLTLELAFPEKSGFVVRGVTGLGPPKAMINTVELSTSDGSVFNSARANARNIVLYLSFMFKPTIEHIRREAYRYFPIKQLIKLTIETDGRICEVYGRVESNEPNIFSSTEGTQISIVCPSAYLQSISDDSVILAKTVAAFTFPFSNESLNEQEIEFAMVEESTSKNIVYTGDSEIGIEAVITATGDCTNLLIYNSATRTTMTINTDELTILTGSAIISGDVINISTVKGNKHATLNRGGVDINIINTIDRNPGWLTIVKGDNVFAYTADTGETNVTVEIKYRTVYEGV